MQITADSNKKVGFLTAETYTGATTVTSGTLALAGTGSIASSASLALATGATFDISASSGASVTTLADNGATPNGSVVLGAQTLTITNASTTFSGVISGSGGLTLSGGTQTLAGANTYTGATTISGGTLKAGVASAVSSSSPLTVQSSGTFDINGFNQIVTSLSGAGTVTNSGAQHYFVNIGGSSTFSGSLTGAHLILQQTGATPTSTLTLTGNNTFGDFALVQSGTLALAGGGSIAQTSGVGLGTGATFDISATTTGAAVQNLVSLGTSSSVVLGTKTLTVTNAGSVVYSDVISGFGGFTLAGGQQTLSGVNTYTGATTISGGTLALSGAGSIAASSAAGLATGATLDISATTAGASVKTLADIAAGQAGAVTLGAQTLTVSNASTTFSGVISGSGGLTVSGGTQTLAGANTYTGATVVSAGALLLAGAGALAGSLTRIATGATFDISGTTAGASVKSLADTGAATNGAVTLGSRTLTIANAAATFSGVISGSGGVTLSSGTQTLAGVNAYTGATTINGGTLALSGLGSISASIGARLATGATLDISGTTAGASAKTLADTASGQAGVVTLGAKSLTITNASTTFSGMISGSGGLTLGNGALTLAGASIFTGGVTLNRGKLTLAANAAAGTGGISFAAGAAQTLGVAAGVTVGNVISGFGVGDGIDVSGAAFSASDAMSLVGSAGGVQTWALVNGAATLATFKLAGAYNVNNFKLLADGLGGTSVAFRNNPAAASLFSGGATSSVLWFNQNSGLALDWAMQGGRIASSNNPIAGFAPGSGWSLAGRADVNGDGTTDVLLNFTSGGLTRIATWLVNNGGFAGFQFLGGFGSASGWAVAGTGDFQGDGTQDILLSFTNGGAVNLFDWHIANGAIQSTDNLNMGFTAASGWNVLGTGDFNGDGVSDILFKNAQSGLVADWAVTNAGTSGAFTSLAGVAPGSGWTFDGIGDFDGDGTSDVLWQNGSTLAIWEAQNGALKQSVTVATPAPAGFAFAGIGDYFGTGTSGVLWSNPTTGQTEIWGIANGQVAQTTFPGGVAPGSGWGVVA